MGALSEYYADADDKALKIAEETVENAATVLRKIHPKLNIVTTVIDGDPKHVIVNEAETFGADLIVIGSHGQGILSRFLMGSVSHAVALHAKCSVQIVRIKNSRNQ